MPLDIDDEGLQAYATLRVYAAIVKKAGGQIVITEDDLRELSPSETVTMERLSNGLRLVLHDRRASTPGRA